MKNVFLLHKKEGETPLEALGRFRLANNKTNKKTIAIKMTYAGRLDPMASGLLILLAGEETKNKDKYLSLDKEYEFEVMFGFATDTYDILGKVVKKNKKAIILPNKDLKKIIEKNIKYFSGKFIQKYPMYSSKTVKGKQLFEYARAGEEVKAPEREVNVKSFKLLSSRTISSKRLLENITKRIKKVNGDFRQKEILALWSRYLRNDTMIYPIFRFKVKCSSGTYVRGIANSLGEKLDIPALAFSIKRTKIGKWSK